jgi:two-component system sensor histidine kinase BaeS
MKSRFPKTIFVRILLAVVVSTIFVLTISQIIFFYNVWHGFDQFIQKQEQEFFSENNKLGIFHSQEALATKRRVDEEFRETIVLSIVFATSAGVIAGILSALYFSKQTTRPLRKLRKGIHKIARNKYTSTIPEEGLDEIKELIKEFNILVNELHHVESLRENLVSDVTHELKTPLTKMIGQLEGMADGVYEMDNEHLKKVIDNVYQLEYLVEQLQELVQVRAGKVILDLREVNLNNIVEQVMAGYQKEGIETKISIPKKLTVRADVNRLREILDNLINNAFKYTSKGVISISASRNFLEIRDTGKGINKEDLPYIFERFYRAEKSRNKLHGGLGLGLSIVKGLVELHGWKILVNSVYGKGTTFRILFNENKKTI